MREDRLGPPDRSAHWDAAYEAKGAEGVSWFQPEPRVSLELIEELGLGIRDPVVDVGGGASLLAGCLVGRGWQDVTVLDVSAAALDVARKRLPDGGRVTYLAQDLLTWSPARRYVLWHDRAVLHFLLDPPERATYLRKLRSALVPGGAIILATFALDGPRACSGLPVARYSTDDLATLLGDDVEIVATRQEDHTTPAGFVQPFSWLAARVSGP